MAIIEAEGKFACVRIHFHRHREVPEGRLGPSWNGASRTQVRGIPKLSEAIVVGVPLRIERSEEENVILETRNVATKFCVDVVLTLVEDLAQEVESLLCATLRIIVGRQALPFKRLGREEARHLAMKLVGARLGDELHDATSRFPILRLETARLNLHFLHERQIDAGRQRTEVARIYADATKAAIG